MAFHTIQRASIQSSLYSQGFPSTGSGSVWERSLTLFEMTNGLCSCHSEQSEESFSILESWRIENEPLPKNSSRGRRAEPKLTRSLRARYSPHAMHLRVRLLPGEISEG